MKLVRLGPVGREVPGVMVGDPPEFFDARSVTPDYDSDFFAASGLDRLREAVDAGALRRLESAGLRIAAPLRRPGKIVCIGLNYRQHVNESGMEIPSEPVVFMKASNTIVGPHDDVIIPRTSRKTDWEVELAVVIGSTTSYLDDPSEASANRGLRHLERRLGTRVPARARRPVGQGQILRNFQPSRTVDRHDRRDRRSTAARHLPRPQRRAAPERQYLRHDLPG